MSEYIKLLNYIKSCAGSFVTIIYDNDTINQDFLTSIKEYLKSEYKIENKFLDISKIVEKTIVFIEYDKNIDFTKLKGNNNVILIVLRKYYETSNTQIFGSKLEYDSNLILLFSKKRIKILKNRFLEQAMPLVMIDMVKIVRKQKLKNLNNE